MIKDIGNSLRKVRQQKNITKKYVADQLGISIRTYSRLESGETPMTIRRLNRLCEILNVTISKILFYQEDANREIDPLEFENKIYSYIDYLENEIVKLKKKINT